MAVHLRTPFPSLLHSNSVCWNFSDSFSPEKLRRWNERFDSTGVDFFTREAPAGIRANFLFYFENPTRLQGPPDAKTCQLGCEKMRGESRNDGISDDIMGGKRMSCGSC